MSYIYHEADANPDALRGQSTAMIGYGNLGRPLALNMRDSGVSLVIGVEDQASRQRAIEDGFAVVTIAQATRQHQILMLMLPDEVMGDVYLRFIAPHLRRNQMLIFASGYCLTFGFVEPPPFVDVGLIAPRTFGNAVRDRYLTGQGFYSFIAIAQEASGRVWDRLLAITLAIGSLRAGAVEVTVEQETELDLFMQQAILPIVSQMIMTSARLLVEHGYPSEAVVMDLYVSGELNDYITRATQEGLLSAMHHTSLTGLYGIFSRLERFDDLKMLSLMERTLTEIQTGRFSQEWSSEYASGYPRLKTLMEQQEQRDLWQMERDVFEQLQG